MLGILRDLNKMCITKSNYTLRAMRKLNQQNECVQFHLIHIHFLLNNSVFLPSSYALDPPIPYSCGLSSIPSLEFRLEKLFDADSDELACLEIDNRAGFAAGVSWRTGACRTAGASVGTTWGTIRERLTSHFGSSDRWKSDSECSAQERNEVENRLHFQAWKEWYLRKSRI